MKHCPNPRCPSLAATGFVAEYTDVVGVCADCGTALVVGAAPEASEVYKTLLQEKQLPRMVVAAVFATAEAAEQAKRRLVANDIPAVLEYEYDGEEEEMEYDGTDDEALAEVLIPAEPVLDEAVDEAQPEEIAGSFVALLVRQDDLFSAMRILELLADSPQANEEEEEEIESDEGQAEVEENDRPSNSPATYPATSVLPSVVETNSPRPFMSIGLIVVIIIVILGLIYGLGGF